MLSRVVGDHRLKLFRADQDDDVVGIPHQARNRGPINKWSLFWHWGAFSKYIYITYANWLVHHSNLSESVWYPPDLSEPSNLSDHPELRESRSHHPELSASPIFEGGHLPVKGVKSDVQLQWNECVSHPWDANTYPCLRYLLLVPKSS